MLVCSTWSDKDIFVLWRYYFEVEYPTDEIRDERFKLFQNALSPTKTQKEVQFHNYPGLADQTRQEFEYEFRYCPNRRQLYNFIFQSDIDTWIQELDPIVRLGLRPPPHFYSVDEQNSVSIKWGLFIYFDSFLTICQLLVELENIYNKSFEEYPMTFYGICFVFPLSLYIYI
jgi:hypothetical protein